MESYIYWLVLGLILLGLEMATGTFYLLIVAVGMAVGGLVAWLGASVVWQLILCAITVVAGTLILQSWKAKQKVVSVNNNFDIGQPVKIIKWHDNGTARVSYRGSEWDAELQSADAPRDGQFYIAAMHGSGLVLTHQKSSS